MEQRQDQAQLAQIRALETELERRAEVVSGMADEIARLRARVKRTKECDRSCALDAYRMGPW